MTKDQENVIRTSLRLMALKKSYAHSAGFLEGVLLTVLDLYVKDRDVETVVRSFSNQTLKLSKETE